MFLTSEAFAWRQPARTSDLGSGEIHVWRVFTEEITRSDARFESLLSPEERSIQQRLLHEPDRRSFATRHGLLRCLLGRYLHMDPAAVPIQRGAHGKPELIPASGFAPLSFSLSHTRGLALFAFSRRGDIGVDVEAIDSNLDPERMAAWILLPAARSRFLDFPEGRRMEAFHSAWTIQEACAKALGLGLGRLLDELKGMEGSESAGNAEITGGLTMMTLEAGPGYAAALAFRGKNLTLQCWQWPQDDLASAGNEDAPSRQP